MAGTPFRTGKDGRSVRTETIIFIPTFTAITFKPVADMVRGDKIPTRCVKPDLRAAIVRAEKLPPTRKRRDSVNIDQVSSRAVPAIPVPAVHRYLRLPVVDKFLDLQHFLIVCSMRNNLSISAAISAPAHNSSRFTVVLTPPPSLPHSRLLSGAP